MSSDLQSEVIFYNANKIVVYFILCKSIKRLIYYFFNMLIAINLTKIVKF
jgi:hypothetical protein